MINALEEDDIQVGRGTLSQVLGSFYFLGWCIIYVMILFFLNFKYYGSVWYMCLKIENYYLKTFVKIRVGEKYIKIRVMLFKNWKLLFENTNQTPLVFVKKFEYL